MFLIMAMATSSKVAILSSRIQNLGMMKLIIKLAGDYVGR